MFFIIQVLISNIWVRQKWHNHYLKWDPLKFSNITVLTVSPSLIWLPDIVLYNNAKNGVGAGTMYQFKTKVKIRYDGKIAIPPFLPGSNVNEHDSFSHPTKETFFRAMNKSV